MGLTRLAELTAPAVAALPRDTLAVLAVGAIEQHGPHLPVATDLLIAQAVTERAAIEATGAALDGGDGGEGEDGEDGAPSLTLLPPLAYTKSNEHAWSPGTLWLSATTLLAVLDDLGRSLAASGIRRLALVNGHGGNTALLGVALRELRIDHGLRTFLFPAGLPTPEGDPGDERGLGLHAGLAETSALLHLHPELVDMTRARRSVPEHLTGDHTALPVGTYGWTSDDLSPAGTGVIGDPTGATADLGRALVAAAVSRTATALREAARFPPLPPATTPADQG